MTAEEYVQLKAFARIDGAWVAGLWTVSFAFYILGITQPPMMIMGMVAAVLSPFYAAVRLGKFRDRVRDGVISFGRAYLYSAHTFFCAALLFAAAQFAYFQFLDNGFLADRVAEVLGDPQTRQVIRAYGMDQAVSNTLQAIRSLRPIDYALNYLTTNIIIGLLLSLPVAAVTKRSKPTNT